MQAVQQYLENPSMQNYINASRYVDMKGVLESATAQQQLENMRKQGNILDQTALLEAEKFRTQEQTTLVEKEKVNTQKNITRREEFHGDKYRQEALTEEERTRKEGYIADQEQEDLKLKKQNAPYLLKQEIAKYKSTIADIKLKHADTRLKNQQTQKELAQTGKLNAETKAAIDKNIRESEVHTKNLELLQQQLDHNKNLNAKQIQQIEQEIEETKRKIAKLQAETDAIISKAKNAQKESEATVAYTEAQTKQKNRKSKQRN